MSWRVEQKIGVAGRLMITWSKKKRKERLVVCFDEPGFKQRQKWLSLDEPNARLQEVLEAFEFSENDILDEFKEALLTGTPGMP